MSDMRGMNAPEPVRESSTGKFIGIAFVVLVVAGIGFYSYSEGFFDRSQKDVVASNDLPAPPAIPATPPAMQPLPDSQPMQPADMPAQPDETTPNP